MRVRVCRDFCQELAVYCGAVSRWRAAGGARKTAGTKAAVRRCRSRGACVYCRQRRGRRCTNLLLTVARYFGGTLLGTGGLVKAYGDAAKAALAAAVFETLTAKSTFSCTVPYQLASRVQRYLRGIGVQDIAETYETEVTLRCRVDTDQTQALAAFITELTNGQRRAVIQDER